MAATSQIKEKFEDYEGFVEKFKPKKNTDDCYTPPAIYEEVLKWIDEKIMPLKGIEVVRPFYPGGDYENFNYPEGSVVIDNPPFSILSKICRHYDSKGIKYFLFAPALTLFASAALTNETFIVTAAKITYENGAAVPTSFRTNMLKQGTKIMVAGDLFKRLAAIEKSSCKPCQRKIIYPKHLVTAASLHKLAIRGLTFEIPRGECAFVRKLDNFKSGIYGAGFLVSERVAAERVAAEREELSDREWAIIKCLGNGCF